MKNFLALILSLALCLMIAACSNNRIVNAGDNRDNSSSSASTVVPETSTSSPADSTTDTSSEADNLNNMYTAYSEALENLLQNHILPDGTPAAELSGDMSENKFALYDVDNDGKEELLLMYTNTYIAGQVGYVFGYDAETNKLQTELKEFPFLTFYDNGIVQAGWSHNQGLAGESFWPYSLYQYAPELDSYVLVGMVDAWDKNYAGTDYQNNPFPSEIDKSGMGIVYYIMEDGQYDTTHPVDASDYNAWINTYIGSASEIQIQYKDMTEADISQIWNGL